MLLSLFRSLPVLAVVAISSPVAEVQFDLELQKDIVENLYALGLICEPVGDPIEWVSPCLEGEIVCNLPDVDQDGEVGITDFLYVLAKWGQEDCLDHWRADINKDRIIGVDDLLIVLEAWGVYDSSTWNRCDC